MAPELTVATMPIHTQSTEHEKNKTKKQKVAAEATAEESEDGASAAAASRMKLICTICLDEADGSSDVTTHSIVTACSHGLTLAAAARCASGTSIGAGS